MKTLINTVMLICISYHATAQSSIFQRLAVEAADLEIGVNAVSKELKSYCFDEYRSAPGDLADYKHIEYDGESKVFVGNKPAISLQSALDQGLLESVGNGLGALQFQNNSGEKVHIVTDPFLITDVKGDRHGATKEALTHVKNGQLDIWGYRETFELEEKKIAVYQGEHLIPDNNPSSETLTKADEIFKTRYNLQSEEDVVYKITSLYNKVKENGDLTALKTNVYLDEHLISSRHPSPEEIKIADANFKSQHNIINNNDFLDKLYDLNDAITQKKQFELKKKDVYAYEDLALTTDGDVRFKNKYNIQSESDYKLQIENLYYDIKDAESIKPEKIMVYRYEGWLDSNEPSIQELRDGDQKFKEKYKTKDLYSLNQAIVAENNLLKLEKEVFTRSGDLTVKDPDREALKTAENRYETRYAITPEHLSEELERAETKHLNNKRNAEYLIRFFSPSYGLDNTTIQSFKTLLNLPSETDLLGNEEAIDQLGFCYKYFSPIIDKKNPQTAAEYIEKVKILKQNLGLPVNSLTDETTKTYFENLTKTLAENDIDLPYCSSIRMHSNLLYILDDSRSYKMIYSVDMQTHKVTELAQFKRTEFPGCFVSKISSDLYFVDNDFANVGELYSAIDVSPAYKKNPVLSFDKTCSAEDIQSIVSGSKIREIAANGDNIDARLNVRGTAYNFSGHPVFKIKQSTSAVYQDLQFEVNRLQNLRKGTGLVGRAVFTIYNLTKTTLARAKLAINTAWSRMTAHPEIDFATELRADLKRNNVNTKNMSVHFQNIEIVKENTVPFINLQPTYVKNDKNYVPR